VLVATACSACELVASTLIRVLGRAKPLPRLHGTRKRKNTQPEKVLSIKQKSIEPRTRKKHPV
jgi:hypothetical protein